jgi:hypothetical protein
MSTLHNFELFAVATDKSIVQLGVTASFTHWGAEQVAKLKIRHMTRIQRSFLRLNKGSHVFVKTWLADVDR